jgi:hypothetical protein
VTEMQSEIRDKERKVKTASLEVEELNKKLDKIKKESE